MALPPWLQEDQRARGVSTHCMACAGRSSSGGAVKPTNLCSEPSSINGLCTYDSPTGDLCCHKSPRDNICAHHLSMKNVLARHIIEFERRRVEIDDALSSQVAPGLRGV